MTSDASIFLMGCVVGVLIIIVPCGLMVLHWIDTAEPDPNQE